MVEHNLAKVAMRVRFPSLAPLDSLISIQNRDFFYFLLSLRKQAYIITTSTLIRRSNLRRYISESGMVKADNNKLDEHGL